MTGEPRPSTVRTLTDNKPAASSRSLRLTARGKWALALAAPLAMGGWALGAIEFYVLAAAALVVPLACLVYTATRRYDLVAVRNVNPLWVNAGEATTVELTAINRGRRRTPLLSCADHFGLHGRSASAMLAPLAAEQQESFTYRVNSLRRGIVPIGPLVASVSDPLRMARATRTVLESTPVVVYPPIERVAPLLAGSGDDIAHGGRSRQIGGPAEDEFFGLRPYQTGDELRAVHWRTTARLGRLMVRQHETPRRGRITVLADCRSAHNTAVSIELVLSAAASVLWAAQNASGAFRLVIPGAVDTGFGAGHQHLHLALRHLAEAQPLDGNDSRRAMRPAARSSIVAITTDSGIKSGGSGIVEALASAGIGVVFERNRGDDLLPSTRAASTVASGRHGGHLLRVGSTAQFASAWNALIATRALS